MYWLVGSVILFCLVFYFYFGHYAMLLFYQCLKLDVKINYWELAVMKFRKVPINDLLRSAIKLKEKDISVKIKDLELHQKSGGRVGNVVNLLLKAKKSKIDLTYHQAAIMDLDEIAKQKKNTQNNLAKTKATDETKTEEKTDKESVKTSNEAETNGETTESISESKTEITAEESK